VSDPARIELLYPPLEFIMELENVDNLAGILTMRTTCRCDGRFSYEDDSLSIFFHDFDRFRHDLPALTEGKADSASLTDLSNWFTLTLSRHPMGALVSVSAYYANAAYPSEGRLTFSFPTNYEIIGMLRDRFRDFPKWW
jgi:hypothetical protein